MARDFTNHHYIRIFRYSLRIRHRFDKFSAQRYTVAPPGGNTGNVPPPEIEKNCCRKMMLFPKALFLATTFPKIDKNSIFLMNFYQKISKIPNNAFFSIFSRKLLKMLSKIPQRIMVLVKTLENLTQAFEIFLKIDQNKAFFVLFSKKFLKIFSKISHPIGFFVQSAKI